MSQPLVLVTGSSGLIGRAVVERLAGIYDVVGLSRTPTEGAPGDFVEFDATLDDSRNQPGWLPDGFVLVAPLTNLPDRWPGVATNRGSRSSITDRRSPTLQPRDRTVRIAP